MNTMSVNVSPTKLKSLELARVLKPGDHVGYIRKTLGQIDEQGHGFVDYVWRYDGPMVRIKGLRFSLSPDCGDLLWRLPGTQAEADRGDGI